MARALALHESAVPVCRGLGFGVRVSVRAYASLVGASRLLVPSAPVGKWQPTVCGGLCALRSAPLQVKQVSSAQPLRSCASACPATAGFGRAQLPPSAEPTSTSLFAAAAATNLRRSHLLASSTLLLGSPSSRARALAPTASPHSRFGFQQTSLSPSHRTTSGPTSAFLRLSQLPLSAGLPSARLQPLNWALDLPASLGLPPPSNLPPIFCHHFWLQWSARALL